MILCCHPWGLHQGSHDRMPAPAPEPSSTQVIFQAPPLAALQQAGDARKQVNPHAGVRHDCMRTLAASPRHRSPRGAVHHAALF